MDADLKRKWIEALRSGEYQQCRQLIRDEEMDGRTSYCCLGVLCIVDGRDAHADEYQWLKRVIGDYQPLVELNDYQGKSFAEIAEFIETNI